MISNATIRLAEFLTDDHFRSGEEIAELLGCTRSAVWKQVGVLRGLGIEVEASPGKGYRLASPLELMDPDRILAAAGPVARDVKLEVLAETGSSNSELLSRPADTAHALVLLAERQDSGRGRRGRAWHSPFGRNIYLSLGWRFDHGLQSLSCLPLVVAIAAARAVANAGLGSVGIKWPNDLVIDGRKLGGCLVEVQGDVNGPCLAVMGIGINVHMAGESGAADIGQPWTDLGSHLPGVSRNEFCGQLLAALVQAVGEFSRQGFDPFREEWARFDVLSGKEVMLSREDQAVSGVARGVGGNGGLLLEQAGQLKEFLSGEASVRLEP